MKQPQARRAPFLRTGLLTLILVASFFASREASAFPWMVKHGYTNCAQCHADPSGGGLLTEYGRGQNEIIVRMVYKERAEDWEPGKRKDFLFGALGVPENLLMGFSWRSVGLGSQFESGTSTGGFIQMQLDLRSQLTLGKFRTYGSIGFAMFGGRFAQITSRDIGNVVSREHWLGYDLNDAFVIRAGRMALPYGVRTLEHTLYSKAYIRTDLNTGQQHGLSVVYNGDPFRGELMAIAGNFQVRPDRFRERGYSGYLEWTAAPVLAFGVSSLVTNSELDLSANTQRLRQAHGLTARMGLTPKLAVLAEASVILDTLDGGDTEAGTTGFLLVDYEFLQGLHGQVIGEWINSGGDGRGASTGSWLSITWFFYSHMDLRLDLNSRFIAKTNGTQTRIDSGLLHFHFYL